MSTPLHDKLEKFFEGIEDGPPEPAIKQFMHDVWMSGACAMLLAMTSDDETAAGAMRELQAFSADVVTESLIDKTRGTIQ